MELPPPEEWNAYTLGPNSHNPYRHISTLINSIRVMSLIRFIGLCYCYDSVCCLWDYIRVDVYLLS